MKQKKIFSKNLKTLTEDIDQYQVIISDIFNGDRNRLSSLFQGHKHLLSLINSSASVRKTTSKKFCFQITHNIKPTYFFLFWFQKIFAHVFDDNCLKQKQLDKLHFQKKQKIKRVFELKVKINLI